MAPSLGGANFAVQPGKGAPKKGEATIKLPPILAEHKTLIIAHLLVARRLAEMLGVDINASLAEICRLLGANRTSVYEQAARIIDSLETLADARPGRPPAPPPAPDDEIAALLLTKKVYEYRLEHPGAVVQQRGRHSYSPTFQRFILSLSDLWHGSLDAFADAARVPIDTLRDWIQRDRDGLIPQQEAKQPPPIPREASQLVRDIANEWQRWQGPTRDLFRHAARLFHLSTAQVDRLLRILGIISRRQRKPFRFRGETHLLAPGTMLVTDGKIVTVHLSASDHTLDFNWQAMVDQTTGCDTAAVVSENESAAATADAFRHSIVTLGGVVLINKLGPRITTSQSCSNRFVFRDYWRQLRIRITKARDSRGSCIFNMLRISLLR